MLRTRSLRARVVALTLLLLAAAALAIGVSTALLVRESLVARLNDDLRSTSRAFSRYGADGRSIPGTAGQLGATVGGSGPGTADVAADPGSSTATGGAGATPPGAGRSATPGGDVTPPGSSSTAAGGDVTPPGGGSMTPGANTTGGPRPPADSLFVRIVDGRVQEAVVIRRFENASAAVPPADNPGLLAAAASASEPRSIDVAGFGSYRVLATAGPSSTVLVGVSEAQLQATVGNLATTELIVAVITLVIAGFIAAVVVRRELRPLERVAVTARRVSALQLDRGEVQLAERMPDTDLRTEIGQVGAALNHMLDHVDASLQARQDSETQLRQFVADASHELRTPLAAIRGYAELTRRGNLSDDTAYSLRRISSQAERMTTLVEDLLLLARLDAGRPLERGEVDLTRLILDAVGDAHAAGPGHRWQLDLPDAPVTVPGDTSRLTQVFTNLLANARTHTPPGTAVAVTLAADGHDARVAIVDEGPGIPPDLLPHVFERFARGSTSRSRENGSTGLGLSIVHAVVAAHGGTVQVASRPGRTAFTVLLPQPTMFVPEPAVPARAP